MKDGRTKRLDESEEAAQRDAFFEDNRVTLVVSEGPAAGHEFSIDRGRMRVGRGSDVELPFDDDAMSSEHAIFELGDAVMRVRDLASTNGLRVNGAEVLSSDLKHGDRISVGEHEFRFLIEKQQRGPKTFVLSDDTD